MGLTNRKTHFTECIPLLSIRTDRTDQQTIYNHSCHEDIPSPTYEMRLTNRKTHFTDCKPLLLIRSIRTDRHSLYPLRCACIGQPSCIGTLSKVDEKPWGRRPEVKIPLSTLLRMLHSSSTWSSERENTIFAECRKNVSINSCIFLLFRKRIYFWLLKWKLDIP